jgi:hypothetical protein
MQVNHTSLPAILKLIAHEVRWNLLQLLADEQTLLQLSKRIRLFLTLLHYQKGYDV